MTPVSSKVRYLIPLVYLSALVLFGCQSQKKDEITPSIALPTQGIPTFTQTSLPDLVPTSTPSQPPTATATPIPELDLNTPYQEISYKIPLTCQWVSDSAAVFSFTLDTISDGFLFYGPISEAKFSNVLPLNDNAETQLITISNLLEDTKYRVAVGLITEAGYRPPNLMGAAWDPIQFQTSSTDQWPIRIGVIGDSGFGGPVTYELTKRIMENAPDFVLHTGDVVYRVEENQDAVEAFIVKYYLPFAPVLHEVPLFPIPGNHDFDAATDWGGEPYYFTAFPPIPGIVSEPSSNIRQYYKFETRGIQIIFLDTQEFWRDPENRDQTIWLEEQLKDERIEYSIPILHVPPFSSGLHTTDGVMVEREWVPLFERYNVPLVISGHDHNYQRLSMNGITYLISGGGSGVLYSMSEPHPGNKFFSARSHFVLLSLYQDRIEVAAISAEGEVLETAEIKPTTNLP